MNYIHNSSEMLDAIERMGFLPLLKLAANGFSAEEMVAPECRYRVLPDGGWEWPLWKWKGPLIKEGHFAYGKFFYGKAGFVSQEWWPDFCNWRRSRHPKYAEGSIEETILLILQTNGSMITRDLRAACGFTGPKMRSRFDSYVSRMQSACRIVTEDFVYPHDAHGHPYGWGWALLTTPESLFGTEACTCNRTPQESHDRILSHLHTVLPHFSNLFLEDLIG